MHKYNIIQKLKSFIILHKITSSIIVIVILFVGYKTYQSLTSSGNETRYVTSAVAKGNLIVSVSGTGQVSTVNQIDIKPKASGDVIYIGAQNGQSVWAGQLIAQLDATDAEKAVRDAEVNLESAKISLEKLRGPEGAAIPRNKDQALEDLKRAYDDGFSNVSNTFINLPTIMSGLQNILLSSDNALSGGSSWNIDYYGSAAAQYDDGANQFRNDAFNKYQIARKAYDKNFQDYKSVSRFSDPAAIELIISQTYETTKNISESVKSSINLIQFYEDKLTEHNLKHPALADTHLSSLNTYTGQSNSNLLSLLNSKNTIKNDKDAVSNADLDIRSQELSLKQRQNALLDAKNNLADYYVRAPFNGVITKINIKKGDSISSGTTITTLITKQKVAEISLNEVDAAKIKLNQKATLTFDAIERLSLTGQVTDIDTLGTVSQGVVTYNVKITFDTQDDRVKSGMSVTAAIITDIKQDALLIPNSAIKTNNAGSYVEIFDQELPPRLNKQGNSSVIPPRQQPVEIGESNDNSTEIISGLKEGDKIVTRTITAVKTTVAPTAPSIFGGNTRPATGGSVNFRAGGTGR
mgnify:CR=1 FL=1